MKKIILMSTMLISCFAFANDELEDLEFKLIDSEFIYKDSNYNEDSLGLCHTIEYFENKYLGFTLDGKDTVISVKVRTCETCVDGNGGAKTSCENHRPALQVPHLSNNSGN